MWTKNLKNKTLRKYGDFQFRSHNMNMAYELTSNKSVDFFLSSFNEQVTQRTYDIRKLVLKNLPNIIEQVDLPAKIIAYSYGNKYSELICVLIPSKKGLKLGFNRGVDLTDPMHLLKGTGKISRYVEIQIGNEKQNDDDEIIELIKNALEAYHIRTKL